MEKKTTNKTKCQGNSKNTISGISASVWQRKLITLEHLNHQASFIVVKFMLIKQRRTILLHGGETTCAAGLA